MPKHKNWFWLSALAAACLFDVLFWKKNLGISFVIWITAILAAGYLLAWCEGKKPAALSLLVSLLTLAFAFVPAWRSEPFTRLLSALLAIGGLVLVASTFLNGHWPFYRMWDYFKNLFITLGGGFSRAFMLGQKDPVAPPPLDTPVEKKGGVRGWAVVRGLMIALPIVAVLALLLSSADPIFKDWLAKVLNLERLPEYLFRLFYIVIITTFLVGVYLHAILPRNQEERPDPSTAWMKPFMGATETSIILAAVDLLFLAFVFIQFRYFFGGAANIHETGYTFSEYARKGFGELVAVAVLSLGLYLTLHTIGKRESKSSGAVFSILSVLLMANVIVMLVSSLQRLLLYENAYGFSQLRTYTHVFIFWLGGLIVVTLLLELFNRRGHFALALLVTTLGFGVTLALMNVNGFIAEKNITRAVSGDELDIPHLVSLSSDAVPVLIEKYNDVALPAEVKEGVGVALACRKALTSNPAEEPWQGFNLSTNRAYNLLQNSTSAWTKLDLSDNDRGYSVELGNGETIYCFEDFFMD